MLVVAEGVNKSRWELKKTGLKGGLAGIISVPRAAVRSSFTPQVFLSPRASADAVPRNGLSVLENRAALVAGWSAGREVQAQG